MDPETMKFAMEQMRKMNPAQLQEMMRNMPPDAYNHAMGQLKDMKPEDWERAKQEMASMDSETLSRQAAQAQAQMAGRTQYVLNASNQLKAEGNQLHGRGAYKEAVEKYERAKSNVESFTSKEARDLARACTLNLSSCYLNLKQYAKCVEQCNSVLSGEPDNLKALYRRGQAHLGSGDCVSAAADLERALKLTLQTDPSQAQPIRDKLQEAKDQIGALRAAGKLPPASAAGAADSKALKASEAGPAERVSPTSTPPSTSAAASGSGGGSGSGGRAGPDPEMLARASEMVKSNPDMLKQAQSMIAGMSDEELRSMAKHMGMDATPEMLRGGFGCLGLDTEMLETAIKLQADLPPELRDPKAAKNPETMKRLAVLMAEKPELANTMGQMLTSIDAKKLEEVSRAVGMPPGMTITPDMAKLAAESFKGMSPKQVEDMIQTATKMQSSMAPASSSTAAGGAAGRRGEASTSGGDAAGAAACGFSPEMAAAAADMMKNMTAEDMARMQDMATKMGMGLGGLSGPGAGGPAGGRGEVGGGKDPMAAMLNDPKMMESAVRMMKNMDPEALASMMMSSGMCKDRAQAAAMAQQMSNLTDAQLNMMVKTASALQNARMAGTRLLNWARANMLLVLAILVLVLALVLRWLGYM